MPPQIPSLFGLVLSGGAGRRMGQDKGALTYHGKTQVEYCCELLTSLCRQAYVSTNTSRAGAAPYSGLPLILDDRDFEGPIAGLQAAWRRHPDVAWLVLAVDMPLVDHDLLNELISARNPASFATAFQGDDGIIEPLCAIWEPAAREALEQAVRTGNRSPRRFLESRPVTLLRPTRPETLTSVNSPEQYEALRRRFAEPRKGF